MGTEMITGTERGGVGTKITQSWRNNENNESRVSEKGPGSYKGQDESLTATGKVHAEIWTEENMSNESQTKVEMNILNKQNREQDAW